MSKKTYTIIIVILVIISGFLFFRSCIPDNGNGFSRIIDNYNRIKNGFDQFTRIIRKSVDYSRELESINKSLQTENSRLGNTIEELRTANESLERITTELATELDRGARSIDNIEFGIGELENIIDRIRAAGPQENY